MHRMKSATAVRSTKLPSGEEVPVLGLGTWHLAEGRRGRQDEIKALRLGLDLGMNLIDTAEMYADGEAEELVGEAIAGRRESVFLVTKVLPHHATRRGTIAACEHSLKRLKTDWIDLYLLHWREKIPLGETVEGFQELIDSERIRYWGVSNFDVSDMAELFEIEGGASVTTDQVLYNITRRGIEFDLMPWCRERNMPIMAYSPIEQGRLVLHPVIRHIAEQHQATPAQVALAWVLRQDGVIAIPQSGTLEHVRENRAALDLQLTRRDLDMIDRAFPPPSSKQPLAVL
ncbi:MAG: oxidoreductase [Acidobacteriaceae bacterium]|nr:oxidoreductase [Acidobacteriaceae bacterium]